MQRLSRVPRRWLALAALAAAVLVVPTASAGSAASIKGVGAAKANLGLAKFELSAHAEADPTTPENGFGQVKYAIEGVGSATIDVRCVRAFVDGTGRPSASITGVVTQSTLLSLEVGETAEVTASDGGEPASDLPVDSFRVLGIGTFAAAETACFFIPPDASRNVEQGNIVVRL